MYLTPEKTKKPLEIMEKLSEVETNSKRQISQPHLLLRLPSELRFSFSIDAFKFLTDFHRLFNEKVLITDSFNVESQ